MIYPVNSIDTHPDPAHQAAFVTAGGDGVYTVWDKDLKTRYREVKTGPSPITAVLWNPQGDLMAYSKGYDWSKMSRGGGPTHPTRAERGAGGARPARGAPPTHAAPPCSPRGVRPAPPSCHPPPPPSLARRRELRPQRPAAAAVCAPHHRRGGLDSHQVRRGHSRDSDSDSDPSRESDSPIMIIMMIIPPP